MRFRKLKRLLSSLLSARGNDLRPDMLLLLIRHQNSRYWGVRVSAIATDAYILEA